MMTLISSQLNLRHDFHRKSFSGKWPHFVISGPPGVGKSFLLQHLAEERDAPYVDLEQGRGNLQLWIQVQREIERRESEFLFLDHVPSGSAETSLLVLEDEVLRPFAEDGGIIIVALCDRAQWSFIQPLRNIYYLFPFSNENQIKTLFQQDDCLLPIQEIEEYNYGNLLLAHYLCHNPTREEACRAFLEHWWQRLHLDIETFDSFLPVAVRLSKVESVSEKAIKGIVGRRHINVDRILSLLRRARWIGGWYSTQKPDVWTSPVRECLMTLCL